MPADELAEKLIVMRGGVAAAQSKEWLEELMPLFTERAQTLVELNEMTSWLFGNGAPALNEDAAALLTDEAKHTLQKVAQFLNTSAANKAEFDTAFKDWMAAEGLKMRDVGLPLRAALTGTKTAPSILDIVRALGTEETLNRINQICT